MIAPLHIISATNANPVAEPPLRSVQIDHVLRPAVQVGPVGDRLFEAGAVAVTTGQQPGLFGGPLYTLHKALAARALAQELERRWKRPVVPLFWAAGDDHDWAEASIATWWTPRGDVRQWRLAAPVDDGRQLSMSRLAIPNGELHRARLALENDLPSGVSRDTALGWIDRHWHEGSTMASAFVDGMRELLDPLGVAVIDPTHRAFKRAQQPCIRSALARSEVIDRTLAAIPSTTSGITAGDGATLVFLEGLAGRDRLIRRGDNHFMTRRGGEVFAHDELLRMLEAAPERFSANVLLRPVVEAALLPTVAYVAGPGEAKYLTEQAVAIYPHLGVSPQAVVPRWSGTVVDATSERLLRRTGLTPNQVQRGGSALERELLLRDLPPAAQEAIARLTEALVVARDELVPISHSVDPVLDRAITGRVGRMSGLAREIEKVMLRHLKRRDDIVWSQYQRLRRRLSPTGIPQERVISVGPALALWGGDWVAGVKEETERWARRILEATPLSV